MELLLFSQGVFSNKWFYSLYIENNNIVAKALVEKLKSEGIQTRCVWDLIHKQTPYTDCINTGCERAENYAKRVINFPCSTNLSKEDISKVICAISELMCDIDE